MLFFLALLFSMTLQAAEAPGCLIVVIGGGFRSTPSAPDIAERVYEQTLAQANRTGCRVATSANQNSSEFLGFIRSLGRGVTERTAVHLTFVGHGTNHGATALDGYVVSGYGQRNWTKNTDFIQALKTTFPAGTRLTYSTNNCYPRWHELMLATEMDETYNLCGVSSADPSSTSRNFWDVFHSNQVVRASYGPLGFMRVNEDISQHRTPTTVSMFHYHARIGDSNTLRNPGSSSSVFYAQQVLSRRGEPSPVPLSERFLAPLVRLQDEAPTAEWARYADADRLAMKSEIENVIRTSLINGRRMSFRPVEDRGVFGSMMVNLARQLSELSVVEPRTLPLPTSQGAEVARSYFQTNASQIAEQITTVVMQAAAFARAGGDEAAWPASRPLIIFNLFTPLFHLRTLQEALVVQKFRAIATDAEGRRFRTLLGCENMPMLSTRLPTDFSSEDWDQPGVRRRQ